MCFEPEELVGAVTPSRDIAQGGPEGLGDPHSASAVTDGPVETAQC